MSDISPTRQRLRDLARQQVAVFTPTTEDALAAVNLVPLGELAYPLFEALQDVLAVTEELSEDAGMPIDPELAQGNVEGVLAGKDFQKTIAKLIEGAVLKRLS